MADTYFTLEGIGAVLGALLAGGAALFAFFEYLQRKAWRKSDLAATLMARLEMDEELALCCHSLDWGVGPMIVPQRYRPLLARRGVIDDDVMDHEPSVMASALEPKLNEETLRDPRGLIYRHCFIKLFNHLDNMSRLVATKQVDVKDLDGLDYWLRRLARYEYQIIKKGSSSGNDSTEQVVIPCDQIFQPALAIFGFARVPELARTMGVSNWGVFDKLHVGQ